MKNNQRRVVVAYRTVPNEPENCIVVTTENLEAGDHDALMKLVESNSGQSAKELADAMARTLLPDGRNMLAGFHTTGKMVKAATKDVQLTPDTKTTIMLDELNRVIAEQKGVSVEDLAGGPTETTVASVDETPQATTETLQAPDNGVLTDDQLAAQYRSQADALFKEAKALREQAEALVPTKKKTTKKTEESA